MCKINKDEQRFWVYYESGDQFLTKKELHDREISSDLFVKDVKNLLIFISPFLIASLLLCFSPSIAYGRSVITNKKVFCGKAIVAEKVQDLVDVNVLNRALPSLKRIKVPKKLGAMAKKIVGRRLNSLFQTEFQENLFYRLILDDMKERFLNKRVFFGITENLESSNCLKLVSMQNEILRQNSSNLLSFDIPLNVQINKFLSIRGGGLVKAGILSHLIHLISDFCEDKKGLSFVKDNKKKNFNNKKAEADFLYDIRNEIFVKNPCVGILFALISEEFIDYDYNYKENNFVESKKQKRVFTKKRDLINLLMQVTHFLHQHPYLIAILFFALFYRKEIYSFFYQLRALYILSTLFK